MDDPLNDADGLSGESDGPPSDAESPPSGAVLLCGGQGTRLDSSVEKPLVEVGDRPMVAHVLDALAASRLRHVVAVTSPHAPATTEALGGALGDVDGLTRSVVVGPGEGYVSALEVGLERVDGPAVTVTADLPLVRARDVDDAIATAINGAVGGVDSVSMCVPVSLKRSLGVTVDAAFTVDGRTVAPTGLNVVVAGTPDRTVVRDRRSLAVNVNRPADLRLARRLAE